MDDQTKYEQVQRNTLAVVATRKVQDTLDELKRNSFASYLDVMNRWEEKNGKSQVAEYGFLLVKRITDTRKRNSKSRLMIRLAIFQALVEQDGNPLTLEDLCSYWKANVLTRLSHSDATALYKPDIMNAEDVVSLAGLHVIGAPAPHQDSPPPIRLVAPTVNGGQARRSRKASHYHYTTKDRNTIYEIDRHLGELPLTERFAYVKLRANQPLFKNRLKRRNNSCCVTGLKNPSLLIASHIKPWSACENFEKLDPDNGLLLAPHLDKLFDLGFITFNEDGSIRISSDLYTNEREILQVTNELKLRLQMSQETKQYMAYHNKQVFRGKSEDE